MSSVPHVFDRALGRARLERAGRAGFADFLVAHAARDLVERLSTIVRRFPIALDLGTPTPHARKVLEGGLADRVVQAAPIAPPSSGAADLVADAEALPFGAEKFDLVVSLIALQSVNDLPGTFLQVRHVLKPDGLLLAALLGGETLAELRHAFTLAESALDGGVSPRVAPFVDVRGIGSLLQRAGFALPVSDVDRLTVRYADAFGLMRDLRAMGLTNTLVSRRRTSLRRGTIMRMAEIYCEEFADDDGRIPATFDLVWVSGWAPHGSQQKPLRPGSAKVRLADALSTTETRVKR